MLPSACQLKSIDRYLTLRRVDLGWASEVLEHVDAPFIPHLLVTLLQAKFVVANAAQVLAGHHHVTVKSWPDFWEPIFAKTGFVVEHNVCS